MIITRTPLRVSFVGGGTDLPGYANKYGGKVISAAINKCVYVTVNRKFDGKIHLRYSKTEEVDKVDEIQHTIIRECLKLMEVRKGIEIVTISDVPMRGTGLGSSSSLTVGLLNALGVLNGCYFPPNKLAEMACHIEIDTLKAPIGKQDQYVAVYGGLNYFHFNIDGTVTRGDLYQRCSSIKIKWLEESTMLFYLDKERNANGILSNQVSGIEENRLIYDSMKQLVKDFYDWLLHDSPSPVVGEIIDLGWKNKKELSKYISNDDIDSIYAKAKESGALGGKVCGAGGGGFLMLVVPRDHQYEVGKALHQLKRMPFEFDEEGSRVIYHED